MKNPTPMTWFVILLIVACGLALGLPPDPNQLEAFGISSTVYRLVILFLLIPYTIIWFCGFYAFDRMQKYASSIKNTPDGKAFRKISLGTGVLAFGLVIPTIVSLIFNSIARSNPSFIPVAQVTGNYITMLVPVIAFSFIESGTRQLADMTKSRPSVFGFRLFIILFTILGVVFTHLLIQNSINNPDAYSLNITILLLTFVVPYLYSWFMGLSSAYEFRLYSLHTKGVIYRQALVTLAAGITVAIAGSVAIQLLDTVISDDISLAPLLLTQYLLLATVATGLILMALGAKKLQKIEEV